MHLKSASKDSFLSTITVQPMINMLLGSMSCTVALKLHGCSLCLFLLLGPAALWWLSRWNCVLLSGAPLNSPFFFAPSGVCFTDFRIFLLSSRRLGLAAFIRLGFSFLWQFLGRNFFLLSLFCLLYKGSKLIDLNRRSKLEAESLYYS